MQTVVSSFRSAYLLHFVSVNSSLSFLLLSFISDLLFTFINLLSYLIGGASTSCVQISLRLLPDSVFYWSISFSDRTASLFHPRIFLSVASSQVVSFQLYTTQALVFKIPCLIFIISAWFSICCLCFTSWASASSSAIFALSSISLFLEDLELLEPFHSELLFEWMLVWLPLLLEEPWWLLLFTCTVHPTKCLSLESTNLVLVVKIMKPIIKCSFFILKQCIAYSSWIPSNIMRGWLNWASFSTATKFLMDKRSSVVLHFLCNRTLIFSVLSFRVLSLNNFPFSVIILNLISGNSS